MSDSNSKESEKSDNSAQSASEHKASEELKQSNDNPPADSSDPPKVAPAKEPEPPESASPSVKEPLAKEEPAKIEIGEECVDEKRLQDILGQFLKEYDLESYNPDCEQLLKTLILKCTRNILSSSAEISRRRQMWTSLNRAQSGNGIIRVCPVVEREGGSQEQDAAERRFSLLSGNNPKKTMRQIERLAQQIESEKRKACLAKMRKEEETRGKARRNKVGNPRYEALKEKVEREKLEQEARIKAANTNMAIEHFLGGDTERKRKRKDLEPGDSHASKFGPKRRSVDADKDDALDDSSAEGEERVRLRVFESQDLDECAKDTNATRRITVKDIVQFMRELPFYKHSKIAIALSLLDSAQIGHSQ